MCRRGEIFWLDLDKYVAKEKTNVQKKTRPFLILQNNVGNTYSPTTYGSAITSVFDKARLPTHIELGYESGLKPSVLMLEQIITIDKCDLGDYIGTVPRSKIYEIDRALIISGGIDIQQQTTTNIVDKEKINNLIYLINNTVEMLEKVENDYFRKIHYELTEELKNYCLSCGTNYEMITRNRMKQFIRGMGDVLSV